MPYRARYHSVSLRTAPRDLARELREALTASPRSIPCKWFYDAAGSQLFDEICALPEYYLTRTESGILRRQAGAILDLCPSPLTLVELGSGTATKTHLLIEACLQRQAELDYYPIDISAAAQADAARGLLVAFPALRVTALLGEFAAGLEYLAEQPGGPRLVLFLGSTIGNFDEAELDEFFAMLRCRLRPEDRFLLGFDLLKDAAILVPAYDDAQGITAQFNLNLLARLNREFGADFDLSAFAHRAVFNARRNRIEMYLVSQRRQTVHLRGLALEITLEAGEAIHTENSYKHSQECMVSIVKRHSLQPEAVFTDPQEMFCLLFLA
jgi:dimethylhistidine N-methyltransferase